MSGSYRGINRHVLPGDLVATTDRQPLWEEYPYVANWRPRNSNGSLRRQLPGNDPCLVLTVHDNPDNPQQRFFLVWSTRLRALGWVHSHDVFPVITEQPHPEEVQ